MVLFMPSHTTPACPTLTGPGIYIYCFSLTEKYKYLLNLFIYLLVVLHSLCDVPQPGIEPRLWQ